MPLLRTFRKETGAEPAITREQAAGSTRCRQSSRCLGTTCVGPPLCGAPCSLESSLVSIHERHSLLPSLGLPLLPAPLASPATVDPLAPVSAPEPLSGPAEANNRRQVRVEAGNAACMALAASSGPQVMPAALTSVLNIPAACEEGGLALRWSSAEPDSERRYNYSILSSQYQRRRACAYFGSMLRPCFAS